MGIYIKGMKMPTGRPIRIEITADGAVREIIDPFLVIPSGTAIELPPHGRLGDLDALRRAMYHEAFEVDSPMQKWDSGCWIRYKMFENAIEAVPTIIPESGGNENE